MAPARVPNAAVWDALRSWIDSHEAQERANGVSAITSAQVEVISNLIKVEEKPDADGRNYVVELNQHSQKQHAGSVDYSKEDHIPPGALGGGGRWRVFCKLSWCNQIFPQPGYGFTEGQEPPSFPSKKLAKQFAAKMAMQYIHDRASSQDLASIVDTKPVSLVPQNRDGDSISSPPPKKAKRELPQSDGNGVTASNGIPVKPIPTKSDLASGSNLREGESSGSNGAQKDSPKIQAMVQQLATRLNYKVPTYTIDVEPNRPGFFRGEAGWRKEPLAPEQPIRVGGVFGEAQATEQLAAKVYEWLGQQGEKREADLAAILADIAQSKLSQAASG